MDYLENNYAENLRRRRLPAASGENGNGAHDNRNRTDQKTSTATEQYANQ